MLWRNLPSGTISVEVLGDKKRLEPTECWETRAWEPVEGEADRGWPSPQRKAWREGRAPGATGWGGH